MAQVLTKIAIPISFETSPEKEISLIGFLFNCRGILLQSQLVINNLLEFDLEREKDQQFPLQQITNPGDLRVFIAPVTDKSIQKVTSIDELENFKPYEPILNVNADGNFNILSRQ